MEAIETTSFVHSVPSCTEKLQSDEQVSKNLFGPPLESAFDHEDFTGDGRRNFRCMGGASRRMGGAIARVGRRGWRELVRSFGGQCEGARGREKVGPLRE